MAPDPLLERVGKYLAAIRAISTSVAASQMASVLNVSEKRHRKLHQKLTPSGRFGVSAERNAMRLAAQRRWRIAAGGNPSTTARADDPYSGGPARRAEPPGGDQAAG